VCEQRQARTRIGLIVRAVDNVLSVYSPYQKTFFLLRRLANCSYERLTLCAEREHLLPGVGLFIAGHNLKLFIEMVLFWRVVCRLLKSGTWKQDAQSLNFRMLTVTMQ